MGKIKFIKQIDKRVLERKGPLEIGSEDGLRKQFKLWLRTKLNILALSGG